MTIVLKGHPVVLGGVTSNSSLDLLRFAVVLQQFVLAQARRNRLHLHIDARVLLLGLQQPPLLEGRAAPELFSVVPEHFWFFREGCVVRVMRGGAGLLELGEELDVGLGDLLMLLVVAVGKGTALGLTDVLLFAEAAIVESELAATVFPDLVQFAEVSLVETKW